MKIEVIDDALVRRTGPAGAPLLLLFPAFGDSGLCYREVFSSDIAQNYRLMTVDLWGFGASPPREDTSSFKAFCDALEKLTNRVRTSEPIGLVGHSIAGSMATEVAHRLGDGVSGVFSIEGNLTPADAMFTGRAADFDDAAAFKRRFLQDIWSLGAEEDAFRHYYCGARMADPETMWRLGRDVRKIGIGNWFGNRFRGLDQPSLYYWSKSSTPESTQAWIVEAGIPNEIYEGAGHWPMVDEPLATADRIGQFFDYAFSS